MAEKSLRCLVRSQLRAKPRIQFTEAEARLVGTAIRQFQRCRLLVFGAGNDSSMWNQINAGGTTVFLEHNANWIAGEHPATALLTETGGVWTDASTFCLHPLDRWPPECMVGGFFVFRDSAPFLMADN
jgi:hypothetical protein